VLAAIVIASASREPTPNPLTPRAYLDRALALIQANALDAPALDWVAVTQHAHQLAADAKTPEDTYPAIEYALSELSQAGDLHARFIDPVTAKLGGGAAKRSPTTQAPAVSLAHKRLGQITLPELPSLPQSRVARRYVANALSGIESLDKRSHPCAWIVDLRGDTGGNAYSMLLAIGPIIGEGRLLGLTGRKGFAYWISYHNSTISGPARYSVQAPLKVAPLAPAPPVAVLTGPLTASAGEFVTVAFRARPQTRSFGLPTAGYDNCAASRRSTAWSIADADASLTSCGSEPSVIDTHSLSGLLNVVPARPVCYFAHLMRFRSEMIQP
jgi:hypothetical protein